MTDPSPQQPGYPTAEQQAAYAQQQAAYAAQQQSPQAQQAAPQPHPQGYQQPSPSPFVSQLPMNMLTLGMAAGGLGAILLGQIIAGGDLVGGLLSLPAAIIVLTALCVTTGEKFRNFYRAAAVALTATEAGSEIGSLIELSPETQHTIGSLLVLAGLGLMATATLTMAKPGKVTPPPNPHAAQPTGVVQQQATQQQYPGGQQPQQGNWQQ